MVALNDAVGPAAAHREARHVRVDPPDINSDGVALLWKPINPGLKEKWPKKSWRSNAELSDG